MEIAFLGWGSLVWKPYGLRTSGTWEKDGRCLPIEFARISKDKRLTLVLYPSASKVRTLWARAAYTDLTEAIRNLAEREETTERNIGYVCITDDRFHCNVTNSILPTIKSWAKQKQFDAVVWTDLASNLDPTPENVLKHLRELKGKSLCDAETYVRKAPQQIKTKIRAILEKEFGWTHINNGGNECDWSKLKTDFENENRIIDKPRDDSYWVVVPKQPCTFGHLLVISWKGC